MTISPLPPFFSPVPCSMKNCGTTVQNALRGVPGVERAEVSFEEHLARVWVREEGGASVEECIDAVEAVGFGAMDMGR